MRRRRLLLLLILVPLGLLVLLAAAVLTTGDHIHADCRFLLHVTGRLVDSRTGEPIRAAYMLSFPRRSWADEDETVARYRRWNKEAQGEHDSRVAKGMQPALMVREMLCAAARSATDGSFDMVVRVPWSYDTIGGIRTGSKTPPDRHGVRAILVEVDGREPQVIDIDARGGDWQEHPDGDAKGTKLWATWDLGRVEVDGTR